MAEKKSHRRPPIPVIVLLVLALIGGGLWWWWSSTQAESAAAAATLSGNVEADQYQITPALAGRVTAVKVAEGDQVKRGDTLVKLDTKALKLQLSQAKEGMNAAKAAVKNAKNDSDSTKADVKAARARQEQAEAAVELVRVQLGYANITAPVDGTVVSVIGNVGQNAAPGKTLLTLTSPSSLFVRVFVPETEVGQVKIGQAASVTTDSSADTFTGKVSFIASESEFTPNNIQTKDQRTKLVYEVRVKLEDASGTLKAGMPVDVTLN